MATFTVGEEVLHDSERFVVAHIEPGPNGRVRLLATTPQGTRFVWTTLSALRKIEAYTRPRDDTGGIGRPR